MIDHLEFIKSRYPHKEKTVLECLNGLKSDANLLHILVAAYVINGGILLKFSENEKNLQTLSSDDLDMESLLKSLEQV